MTELSRLFSEIADVVTDYLDPLSFTYDRSTNKELLMYGSQKNLPPSLTIGTAQYTKPEMPEGMSQFGFNDLRKAWEAINESQVAHAAQRLDDVLSSNEVLAQWEIDQLAKVFEKFSAKYTPPLAKAMK